MNTTRKIAVITGVIFIIATVINLIAAALTAVPTDTDYLTWLSAHPNQVAGGALLYLISFFASGGIAIAMYPVLKEKNSGSGSRSGRLQSPGGGILPGRPREPAVPADTRRAVHNCRGRRSYDTANNRQFVGEHPRLGRAGGGVRLLPGCISVLLPVLRNTAHSPMAFGLRYRCDPPDADRLRAVLVQR